MKNGIVISETQIQLIRKHAAEAEHKRQLSPEVLQLIYEQQWLKIMEPEVCEGLAWSLPAVVHSFESLAYADGNVGWCVNLGAGANLFSGYLNAGRAKTIFSPATTWCAGSGAISGRAVKTTGGWRLSGRWKYASGSAHASHFTANGYLFDEHNKAITENGEPVFRSFILPAKNVQIIDTWHTSGLKASSSHDFAVDNIFIPDEQAFTLTKPSTFAKEAIFSFPFDALAVVNMACMPTGMALHFLELFEQLMNSKKPLHSDKPLGQQPLVQQQFEQCRNSLQIARTEMYESLNKAWQPFSEGHSASSGDLNILKNKARIAAQVALETVHQLFPFCGMTIIYQDAELNKVWRDISVAGQHYLLSPIFR